ncbi:hypothetical protein V5O48_005016 [Marasmius crinis-equi]|uniref:Terpene synthase n=1 Tax=Marasmius crinis-equi TaxID=585013 RepID=A0ABR3FNG8_9AGAR
MGVHSKFPPTFVLQNICDITSSVFDLKRNANQDLANEAATNWFKTFGVYDSAKTEEWLKAGRFDLFTALGFPDADSAHLKTCMMVNLWAFSVDDLSDEGELKRKPDEVDRAHDASCRILNDTNAVQPCDSPYAAMLWEFIQAYRDWSAAQVQQASNRNIDRMPTVQEFILMRRTTIGAAIVEAMVEYSLDIELPDYVFRDPIFIAMSQATTDIMTWPNDLCSFNKEQSDGDYQNLVCILQHADQLDLQQAIDLLTQMIHDRVNEYAALKQRLPSFGSKVDAALKKYHTALENFVQGCIVWYWSSPRYFRDVQPLKQKEVVICLFPRND